MEDKVGEMVGVWVVVLGIDAQPGAGGRAAPEHTLSVPPQVLLGNGAAWGRTPRAAMVGFPAVEGTGSLSNIINNFLKFV